MAGRRGHVPRVRGPSRQGTVPGRWEGTRAGRPSTRVLDPWRARQSPARVVSHPWRPSSVATRGHERSPPARPATTVRASAGSRLPHRGQGRASPRARRAAPSIRSGSDPGGAGAPRGLLPNPERSPPLRLYRIHWEEDALRPPPRPPRARFDRVNAPVAYANGSLASALPEVLRRPRSDPGRRGDAARLDARRDERAPRAGARRCRPSEGRRRRWADLHGARLRPAPGPRRASADSFRACRPRRPEPTRSDRVYGR